MQVMYYLLLLLLFISPLCSTEESLVILLGTETKTSPLYVAPILSDQSGFSKDYIDSLQKILQFDFDHNGMTSLVKPTQEMEKLNVATGWDFQGDLSSWSSKRVHYVIKTRIKDNRLSARALKVSNHTIKSVEGLPLTGNLSEDRRQIHALSDSLFKALFDTEGIASTQILYTLKKQDPVTKKWISDVIQADYDGGNARRVTQGKEYCITPAYIPPKPGYTSRNYAYVSYKTGQPKIYLGNLQDGTIQRFSLLKGNQLMPAISRQRDKIAFISDVTGNPDLFLQNYDPEKGLIGKPRQIFAAKQASQATPSFSPDGKKLAFVSDKDGSARVYMIDIPSPETRLNDIKAKLISKVNRESSAPNWSSDGTKIAFCAKVNGVRQIWIYDFITHTERQLTDGPGNKENPVFAQNSLHLIFNSSDRGASELYLINLNQQGAVQITSNAQDLQGEKHFPAWE